MFSYSTHLSAPFSFNLPQTFPLAFVGGLAEQSERTQQSGQSNPSALCSGTRKLLAPDLAWAAPVLLGTRSCACF